MIQRQLQTMVWSSWFKDNYRRWYKVVDSTRITDNGMSNDEKEISMAFNNFVMAVIKKLNLKISQHHSN